MTILLDTIAAATAQHHRWTHLLRTADGLSHQQAEQVITSDAYEC